MTRAQTYRGVVAGTNVILYDFPRKQLDDAFQSLFGRTSEEVSASVWAAQPRQPLIQPAQWHRDDAFERVCLFLDWQHEIHHLRHLGASAFGFFINAIADNYALFCQSELRAWLALMRQSGKRCALPAFERYPDDPAIQRMRAFHDVVALVNSFLRYDMAHRATADTKDAASVFRVAIRMSEPLCNDVLGTIDAYPDVEYGRDDVGGPASSELTGQSIIEGLARINEYLTLHALGAPSAVVERYRIVKAFGQYDVALRFAEEKLRSTGQESLLAVALLLDWALQTPALPFLLTRRGSVTIQELLPACRFHHIVVRFAESGFSIDDLLRSPADVEAAIFEKLQWEAPTVVADGIARLEFKKTGTSFRDDMCEKLMLGSRLRRNRPGLLCWPWCDEAGHVNALQTGVALFEDQQSAGLGDVLVGSHRWGALCMHLMDRAISDGCLRDGLGWGPFFIANCVTREVAAGSARDLVCRRLTSTFGVDDGNAFADYFARHAVVSESGPISSGRLPAMRNRAERARLDGRLSEALALHREVLRELNSEVGERHPETLTAMNDVAVTLNALGESDSAQQLLENVLRLRREVFVADDHPAVLQAMRNLAATCWAKGQLERAAELEETALEGYGRQFGWTHPATLTAMTNLAATYWSNGDHRRASELEIRALSAQQTIFGTEHPNTTVMAWNLFRTLQDVGDRAAARAVGRDYLSWLVDAAPNQLTGDQRTIRKYFEQQ